jgi:RimJ/RimL family protein N-acetyltransferase
MDVRARLSEVWPLFGLSIRTPRLELRYPTDDDLLDLAERSGDIHDPGLRPFAVAWNDADDETRLRRVLQFHWGQRSAWTPEAWRCGLVTVVDGAVVGTQDVIATGFAVSRTVETGSWLGRAHQGRGIGTEMRAAVLHLAFAGLGAERAETGAFEDNDRSLGVTTRIGYRRNGDAVHVDGADRRRELRFVLSRSDWEAGRRDDIDLGGLEPCLPLFGLGAPGGRAIP